MNNKLLTQIQICRKSVDLIVTELNERASNPCAH